MMDLHNFWGGVLIGLLFAGWFKIIFGRKYTFWDYRRGWVLKWEDDQDDFNAGVKLGRELAAIEATAQEDGQ